MSASECTRRPARSSIPTTFHAMVAALLMARHCLRTGRVSAWALGTLGVVAILCLVVSSWRSPSRGISLGLVSTVGICALFSALSLISCSLALGAGHALERAMACEPVSGWRFVVESDPVEGRYGRRCRSSAIGASGTPCTVWLVGSYELEAGDEVSVTGSFRGLGEDEWATSSRMQGIWGTVDVATVRRVEAPRGLPGALRALRDLMRTRIDPRGSDAGALVAGALLADRRAFSERGLDVLCARSGISHLVAVSGAHIAIVASLVGMLMERTHHRPAARVLVTLLVSGLFVIMCGAPLSAVRAWVMSAFSAVSGIVGRRGDALGAVALAGLGMVLIDPSVSGQLSFLLSLTCVSGLALFGRYASYLLDVLVPGIWVPRSTKAETRIRLRKLRKGALEGLGATLVAQVASAPLTLSLYGQLPVAGPVINLLVSAPFTGMVTAGALALALAPLPPLCRGAILLSEACAWVLLAVARLASRLPLACVPASLEPTVTWALTLTCALVLYAAWPRLTRARTLAAIGCLVGLVGCLLVRWRYLAPARICVLDVGQGDAILVQDGASAILVDTGPDSSVVDALARNHVLHLDAIVITHLHDDHMGGTDDLAAAVGCGAVVVARGVARNIDGDVASAVGTFACPVEEVGYGDSLVVGGFVLEVVSPTGEVAGDVNADSIELLVRYEGEGGLVALLTGDAEHEETAAAIGRGDVGDVDLLKVGHHGSAVSVDAEDVRTLRPEVAVASAGEGNSYGHPREECVRVLEEGGARFLCTKDVGDVEVRPGVGGPLVFLRTGA